MKPSTNLFSRGIVLFTVGTFFTFVLNLLQSHRHCSSNAWIDLTNKCSQWWLPSLCGSGSVLIGFCYPYLKFKDSDKFKCQEWSHVLRCVAMFIGINEACSKVEFPSNLQLSLSLAILSIGLWWYFDGTPIGFAMGAIVAILTMLITQILVYNQICIYTDREYSYLISWLPSIAFSGGITIGTIGEQLAVNDYFDGENKSHAE